MAASKPNLGRKNFFRKVAHESERNRMGRGGVVGGVVMVIRSILLSLAGILSKLILIGMIFHL